MVRQQQAGRSARQVIETAHRAARASLTATLLLAMLACGGEAGRDADAQSAGRQPAGSEARPVGTGVALAGTDTDRADTLSPVREERGDAGMGAQDERPLAPDTSRAARLARRVPRPDSVRALYVNAWAAGSRPRMADLIRIADATEINAFIIDIKESDTYLAYSGTRIPLALEIGADQRPATRWLPALIDTLNAHGIFSIARIVVFKDRMLAEKKPELAIRHVNGEVWKDNKGGPWVNPYDKRVWDYNIAIAKEALDMGFGELQWDYVRFPDVTNSARAVMRYPGSDSVSRAENIRAFIAYARRALAEYKVPVTADVFGLVTHLEGDVEIGQNWEKVISVADVVLPMVYPSHYAPGLYGFARPIQNPYQIVRLAVTDAVERTRFVKDSTGGPVGEVMPWLEAMSIRGAEYGAREIRAQIQATYDAGAKSWALWNPGSKFTVFEDALRPASGGLSAVERAGWTAPEWELPRARLSKVILNRERAVRLAQDSARRRDSIAAAATRSP